MKVYSEKTNEERSDYIGTWYKNQATPQPLYLAINSMNDDISIKTELVGGGMSMDEYDGKILYLPLPSLIYSDEEGEEIFDKTDALCTELLEEYEEYFDQGRKCYIGQWNQELRDKLEELLKQFNESELFFDIEGVMDEKEEENDSNQ